MINKHINIFSIFFGALLLLGCQGVTPTAEDPQAPQVQTPNDTTVTSKDSIPTEEPEVFDPTLAFPGAEGFGRKTTGGRGGQVYHVTNLNDAGPGSLRQAVTAKNARIIVFDVAGTIQLKSELRIKDPNITILGQTAPGAGICVAGYPFVIAADNVIIRYLRFRLGNKNVAYHEGDGLGSMDQDNIIIDHCSISWSIDECCSVYGGNNITVQWCIISQSLKNAGHSKGPHGYGGNWGGSGCTYAHNLLCHHESRTPRLGPRQGTQLDERLDLRNNVIYNWGGNGCYGGEGMHVNIVNNYYKPGPQTKTRSTAVQKRIAKVNIRTTSYCEAVLGADGKPVSGNNWLPMWHKWGTFYVSGNVNPDYADVTADNWGVGFIQQIVPSENDGYFNDSIAESMRLTEPIDFPTTSTWTAEEAYERVLDYAGCLFHSPDSTIMRDSYDEVMVSDTRNGKATYGKNGIIDSQEDAGGWPNLTCTSDERKAAIAGNQTKDIEAYANALVADITKQCIKK